jgi:transcriptional regulator with XRE-family HTH domain
VEKTLRSRANSALILALKQARLDAGMSQQQVAAIMRVPQSFVAKVELGERRLDVIEFLRMTNAIGASWVAILEDVEVARRKRS